MANIKITDTMVPISGGHPSKDWAGPVLLTFDSTGCVRHAVLVFLTYMAKVGVAFN